jgi:methanogen homocitrate synthase
MIDSSGAEPEFLQGLVRDVLAETDIDSLTAVDTFGRLTPAGTAAFVSALRAWSGVPIEIHVHNDFGLGTANSLAAIEAGAEVVHTNMLGLGERSGGVPTEEVAAALEFIYGVDTGIELERLRETARVFEESSGVHMPGHKAVIGANCFTYEVGIAAMFAHRLFKKEMPLGVVPYRPELVGGQFDLALGKKAGKYNVIWELEKMERSASEEQIREMVEHIKTRAIERKGPISREEFASIYEAVVGG